METNFFNLKKGVVYIDDLKITINDENNQLRNTQIITFVGSIIYFSMMIVIQYRSYIKTHDTYSLVLLMIYPILLTLLLITAWYRIFKISKSPQILINEIEKLRKKESLDNLPQVKIILKNKKSRTLTFLKNENIKFIDELVRKTSSKPALFNQP